MKGENGSLVVKRTVEASVYLDLVQDRLVDGLVDAAVGDLTLEAVLDILRGELATVVPLDPLRSLKTYVRGSVCSQDSARPGTTEPSG